MPKVKLVQIINTTTGTTKDNTPDTSKNDDETLIKSAERAKKVLVIGLFFANALV
jgi:hypothetical protein